MNLHEAVLKTGRPGGVRGFERCLPSMGPPTKRAPKTKSGLSSSRTSELPWGKSHQSFVLNSSSNRRSTSSKSTTDNEDDKIIVAITEGRGDARCEVGLAAINVSTPVLVLCQLSDSQSYTNTLTKLNIFNPHLIIYPASFEAGNGNRLIADIRKHFPTKKLITIPRKSFNKTNGLDRLYKICITSCFPLLNMNKNRYYALAAASGLLTYLQNSMYIYYASKSIKLDYQASEGYAVVDIATADRLELVCCNQPAQANKYSSLFGIMNRCLTRVGTRNLRSIILQPLYSKQKINERLNCVEELIKNPEILLSVQGVLPKLSCVDQLLALSTLVPEDAQRCTNRQLNYLLLLNTVVDSIQPLKEALKNVSQPFFVELSDTLNDNDFEVIKNLIRETIHEQAYSAKGPQADQQRIWAIKPGLNGLLDLVRKTYSERIEDMREYIKKLGQKYDLSLTFANNNKKGYHIIMTLNQNQKQHMTKSDLPEEFIQVFRLANSFTMKTAELVNFSTRIDDILTDLFTLSNLMIHHIIVKIKQYADLFYRLVEGISYLDVLQSLAEASYASNWVRPKFDEYTEVTFGRHPLLDFLCQKRPVANPVVSCEHYNLHIITGPNGAGKSIFIRQVMLLQIMAQAGCFVPAQTAIFRPADKMFARISNDDDMESNASTFVLEMTEINYILTTMTDRSLIIIDELCRSTSVEEGTAIAMSICQTLAQTQAYTFVTTHFTLLRNLQQLFFNVKVWQLLTVPSGDSGNPKTVKLDFKFSLMPGPTTLRGYGIYLVRGIWPAEVVKYVDELQERLTKKAKDPRFPSLDHRVRLRYHLDCKLTKLKLQKKFTLANLNKHVDEYNREMQTFGCEDVQYSQNIVQQFHQSMEEALTGLDHSIFDASEHSQPSVEELSKMFLDDFSEEVSESHISLASQSSVAFDFNRTKDEGPVIFTPAASEVSEHSSISSPSKGKERMKEMFTPNTSLDVSESSTYHTIDFYQNLNPEVNLSFTESQCSLNLTQQALELEAQLTQSEHQNDNDGAINRTQSQHSRNIFKGCGNLDENISRVSQLSSNALSQKLESIRKQTAMQETITPFIQPPILSKQAPDPSLVPESPFLSTFARPLQDDFRKTSTPLVLKIQPGAKNFESTSSISTSTVFQRGLNVTHVNTPRISFTVPGDVVDLEIASIVEDLESFVGEMEKGEINCEGENETFIPGNTQKRTRKSDDCKFIHVFPVVTIIQGPDNPSSEEDLNCASNDEGAIVRPIIKIPQLKHTPKTDTSGKGPIIANKKPAAEVVAINKKENAKEKDPIKSTQKLQKIHDIDVKIRAFYKRLSNPNAPIDTELKFKDTDNIKADYTIMENGAQESEKHFKTNDEDPKSEEEKDAPKIQPENDIDALIVAFKTLSNIKEPNKTNHNKHGDHEEETNDDIYDTALSGEDITFSPLVSNSQKDKEPEKLRTDEVANICQDESNEKNFKEESGNNVNAKRKDADRIKETERVDEVIELLSGDDDDDNNDGSKNNATECGEASLNVMKTSNVSASKGTNKSYDTDYERSTEKFLSLPSSEENLDEPKTESFVKKDLRNINETRREDEVVCKNGKNLENQFVHSDDDGNIATTKKIEINLVKCYPILVPSDASKDGKELVESKHGEDIVKGSAKNLEKNSAKSNITLVLEDTTNDGEATSAKSSTPTVLESSTENGEGAVEKSSVRNHTKEKTRRILENKREMIIEILPQSSECSTLLPDQIVPLKKINVISDINVPEEGRAPLSVWLAKRFSNVAPPKNQSKRKNTTCLESCPTPTEKSARKKIKWTDNERASVSGSTNSAENKEKTREITSISDASKLRNLDGDFTSSSSEGKNGNTENNKKIALYCEAEVSTTNLSEVSKKRNLDKEDASTSSPDKEPPHFNTSRSNEDLNSSKTGRQRKKVKKFSAPLKKRNTPLLFTGHEEINLAEKSSFLDKSDSTPRTRSNNESDPEQPKPNKFIYPSKLSQKAIRDAFFEQDKKFFESSGSSSELAKMWEERLKRPPRPTPRQIQQTTCLATIRKTNEGVEVIPTEKKKTKHATQKKIHSSYGSGSVNMNIFSDQNAETFDQFIKSDKKDYKSFNFKFGYDKNEERDDMNMFDFRQVQSKSSEYTPNSQSWTFVRKRSEEFNLASLPSTSANFPLFISPPKAPNDFSLTPEGFYKQNREDIAGLLKKYN